MSVEILSRQRGAIVRCGNGALAGQCACYESFMTGQILAGLVRAAASKAGWGRSQIKGFRRVDLCPAHVIEDRERTAEQRRVSCGHPDCVERFDGTSALPQIKREQAKRAGWGRGDPSGRKGKKPDLCPAHMADEHRRVAGLQAKAAA